MRVQFTFGIILVAIQLCSSARILRNVNHNVLTSSTIYNGDVDRVRESLEPYMQPQELNKFLDIVYKFRNDAPRGQSILAMKELFALIFASHSSTSEADWLKILSGDGSVLTQKETTEISLSAQQSPNDKFRLLKTMARLRMNGDDADHIIGILNNLSSYRQFGKGQRDLTIAAMAAISGKTETEARRWIL